MAEKIRYLNGLSGLAALLVAYLVYKYVDLKGIDLSKTIYSQWFSGEKMHASGADELREILTVSKQVNSLRL